MERPPSMRCKVSVSSAADAARTPGGVRPDGWSSPVGAGERLPAGIARDRARPASGVKGLEKGNDVECLRARQSALPGRHWPVKAVAILVAGIEDGAD